MVPWVGVGRANPNEWAQRTSFRVCPTYPHERNHQKQEEILIKQPEPCMEKRENVWVASTNAVSSNTMFFHTIPRLCPYNMSQSKIPYFLLTHNKNDTTGALRGGGGFGEWKKNFLTEQIHLEEMIQTIFQVSKSKKGLYVWQARFGSDFSLKKTNSSSNSYFKCI